MIKQTYNYFFLILADEVVVVPVAAAVAATGTGREAENAVRESVKWALEYKWMIELLFGQAPSLFWSPPRCMIVSPQLQTIKLQFTRLTKFK